MNSQVKKRSVCPFHFICSSYSTEVKPFVSICLLVFTCLNSKRGSAAQTVVHSTSWGPKKAMEHFPGAFWWVPDLSTGCTSNSRFYRRHSLVRRWSETLSLPFFFPSRSFVRPFVQSLSISRRRLGRKHRALLTQNSQIYNQYLQQNQRGSPGARYLHRPGEGTGQ